MYCITPVGTSDSDLQEYASLLQSVFPQASRRLTHEYLAWQYRRNPIGKVVGFDARFNGELAAHYVTIPVEYWVDGQKRKGLLSLNTATAVAHQGKGLFKTLAEKTYEQASSLGYEFVVGVANQNSTYGFTKKLGFKLIAPLEARIGVFRQQAAQEQVQKFALYADHSEEWWKWRLSNPSQSYRVKGGQIVANTRIPGLAAILSAMEQRSRLGTILPDQFDSSHFPFSLWIGIDPAASRQGFSCKIPMIMRPSPLNFIFRNLKQNKFTIEKDALRFELIDFDAY